MENLIEAIRTALQDDADLATRITGVMACRRILAVLEAATAGEPTAAPATTTSPEATEATSATSASAVPGAPAPAAPAPAAPTPVAPAPAPAPAAPAPGTPIDSAARASLVASLGKLPPEQLLDLAIARLRAALPAGTSVPAVAPPRFQFVPLHHLRGVK